MGLMLLSAPVVVFAHAGHDHGSEFQQGSSQPVSGIRVDPETATRLGIVLEPVMKDFLDVGVQTTGEIEAAPDKQVVVNAPINGTVVELLVQPGETVEQGQPLAIVVAPDLIELRVSSQEDRTGAESDLRQAQANLTLARRNYERQVAIAQSEIEAAQRQLTFAQDRYERDQDLLAEGAIARQQALESEAEWAEAQSILTRANSRESVLEAEAELERARAEMDAAQRHLQLSTVTYETRLQQLNSPATAEGKVTVVAPISGTVAERGVTLGEAVEEAVTPMMTIVNGDRLRVTANIFEKDLSRIAVGQRVRASVASLPDQTVNGRVVVVGSVVDGDTRVIPVTAELDNPNRVLKPGMFAELEVLTERTPTEVLTIPTAAVIDADGRPLVFVQNGDAFEPVEVTLGRTAGDRVEVVQGLFEGDQVVAQGGLQLYAQSLLGDDAPETDAEASTESRRGIPWWVMIPVSGAIATGTFFLGRRLRPVAPDPAQTSAVSSPTTQHAEPLEKAGVE